MAKSKEKQETAKEDSIASKSARGATFLILLQVGSRAITFAANQLLLRFITPDVLGIATQLEVYSISVLFFARESLRVAIQRQRDSSADSENDEKDTSKEAPKSAVKSDGKPKGAENIQAIVNLAYVSIALGILFAITLGLAYARSASSSASFLSTPYFKGSLKLYAIAAIIELLAEPCFVYIQQKSDYKTRAGAEATGTLLRCVVTCAFTAFTSIKGVNAGVLPFAVGQMVYAISVLTVYSYAIWGVEMAEGFEFLPVKIRKSKTPYYASYFNVPLSNLAASLFAQGILKHLLTQGDTILISLLASLPAQGVYALASNYGGLMARMLFQPIEESSRNYFGKLLSSIDGKPEKASVKKASEDLARLLRVYALIGICAVTVGPSVAPLLLQLVVGSRWSSTGAGEVLGKYCYYIPLLAFNGVLESFVSVSASQSELNRQSAWMLAFSAGFASMAYLFLGVLNLGAEGLVFANMGNMELRIVWCCSFIKRYMQKHGGELSLGEIMPSAGTMSAAVGTVAVLHQLQQYDFENIFYALAIYGIAALSFLLLL